MKFECNIYAFLKKIFLTFPFSPFPFPFSPFPFSSLLCFSGSFAVVRHGISKTDGTEWAIKCIDKSQLERQDEEALQTEVEILKQVGLSPQKAL